MTADPETLQVYDARAQDYAQSFAKDHTTDPSLQGFVAALPGGLDNSKRVLDLGCGPGSWSRALLAAGLQVDAVDASAAMVAEAGQIPGLNVWQASFDDIDMVARYHGIWANFSLLHATREDMPRHLAALDRALVPGGVLHIGLKEGRGARRDALGRFYTYWTPPELTELLAGLGLRVSDLRHGADKGLDGTVAAWFTLTAHKDGPQGGHDS